MSLAPTAPRTRLPGKPRALWPRVVKDRAFVSLCMVAASGSVVILLVLLGSILLQGTPYLDLGFVRGVPSRHAAQAGMWPAIVGSVWVCALCAFIGLPIGIGTAVFLEEFQPRGRWLRRFHGFVQLNIANLAGVPSIVYGIIGLTVFVELFGAFGTAMAPALSLGTERAWYHVQIPLGRGVLSGALTLTLVTLPVVIIATQEALRAVPDSLRQAALGLGATRLQSVARVTLPAAVPGIMTGSILAMSRAIGEAAPVLVIAGIVYITYTPDNLMDGFTVMPLQIFNWAGMPQKEFHSVAAAGILVLLGVLFCFNVVAVFIRHKFQKPLS